jgi:hypothetical protein
MWETVRHKLSDFVLGEVFSDFDDARLEQDGDEMRSRVPEVGPGSQTFCLDDREVVEHGSFVDALCAAEVDLFLVNHRKDLPGLPVDGYSSILGTTEALVELTVIHLKGLQQHEVVHRHSSLSNQLVEH